MSSRFDKIEGLENIDKIEDEFNGFEDKKKVGLFRSADKEHAPREQDSTKSGMSMAATFCGFNIGG